ncbi:MAG: ATP-binding cassette domain-containing protein [Planctomycetes bacterium]|nr:ATP-binding cassette domain-containing protein [Planctomycetota bacterium]
MTRASVLTLEGVQLSYRIDEHLVPVLRSVDLELGSGELMLIEGELGAGKSALVNVLAGLERPDAGHIELFGIDLSRTTPELFRQGFAAFVGFFAPWFRLDGRSNLVEMVADTRRTPRVDPERVFSVLGLDPDDDRPFGALDARERRKVDCARVLLGAPRLIVADLVTPPWGRAPEIGDLVAIHREFGLPIVATVDREIELPGTRRVRLESGAIVGGLACA